MDRDLWRLPASHIGRVESLMVLSRGCVGFWAR